MRKITNNQNNILVGPRIPKVLTKRQDIKVSLNEIQKLSTQIDMQFMKNQSKQKNISQGYYQTNQANDNRELLQSQQSQRDSCSRLYNNNSQYKQQQYQQDDLYNNNSTTMDKAVNKSILQYYYGFKQDIKSCNNNNNTINKELEIEQFSQYKTVSKFNKDFIQIKDKLEKLRRMRLGLGLGQRGSSFQQQYQQQQNDDELFQSESDVIKMLKHILLHKERSEANINNNNNNDSNYNSNLLQCIHTIQLIKQTIQNKIEHLTDGIEHKQSIIAQLLMNKSNVLDDIDIIQSRNNKLKKQLGTYYGEEREEDHNDRDGDKLNYGHSNNDDSREQSQQQQQQQQPQQQPQEQPQQQPQEQPQEQPDIDCQQQYLQLMQLYHLYNPQTQTITNTFPKVRIYQSHYIEQNLSHVNAQLIGYPNHAIVAQKDIKNYLKQQSTLILILISLFVCLQYLFNYSQMDLFIIYMLFLLFTYLYLLLIYTFYDYIQSIYLTIQSIYLTIIQLC